MWFQNKKKFYITTSIPYTNAPPHVGHALEFIQADVLARYHKAQGEDVFFLTGSDEHGLKTLRAAEAAGKEVMVFAEETSGDFKKLLSLLDISNDAFYFFATKRNRYDAAEGRGFHWEVRELLFGDAASDGYDFDDVHAYSILEIA